MKKKRGGMTKHISGTEVHTITREEWLRERDREPVHFVRWEENGVDAA